MLLRRFTSPAERKAIRDACRADFYTFCQFAFYERKGMQWAHNWHHRVICDALMRVFRGEVTRLIVNLPPRYSKTELVVRLFIAWCLGHVPDSEWIHTSYAAMLAAGNAADVREIVQSDFYRLVFPEVQLAADTRAKDHWKTTAGGVVFAQGSGGPLTGFGAGKMRPGFSGAIVIDDPHKADEARSDTIRKSVIDWFQNTLESRKNDPERTPIIVVMQRLHEQDLAGFLLGERKEGEPPGPGGNGEVWEHLCLPAIQPDGSALWPQKHTIAQLLVMEQANPYVFAGQYQQRPSPLAGGLFKPDQIEVVDAMPAGGVRWVRGWDLAGSKDGDWTAGPKLVQLADGRYVIADVVRLREGPHARDAAMKNTAARDGTGCTQSIPQDPGQAGKTQVLYLTRLLAGYPVHTSPESGDKWTRAEPLAAQVNVGNVLMLRGPWNAALLDEMRSFPNGAYDDQVDGLSRAFARLVGPIHLFGTATAPGL